jgi:hypothetical protein
VRATFFVLAVSALALLAAGVSIAGEVGTNGVEACAKGYSPCLPVVSDLDCDQIPDSKKPVRVTGDDPYGLDRDKDGVGCESTSEGGGAASPWGLVLRKGQREALTASIGDTLTVVGWSPAIARGTPYELYGGVGGARKCVRYSRPGLRGTFQTLGRWKVQRFNVVSGKLVVALRVKARMKASDSVRIR